VRRRCAVSEPDVRKVGVSSLSYSLLGGRKLLDRVGVGSDPAFDLLPGHWRGDGKCSRARRVGADRRRAAAVAKVIDRVDEGQSG
jgi:hypothetical protein